MVQQFRMFGDRALLDRAALVAEFVWSGWAEGRRPRPGGLYWVDARWNRDRGASTNLGAAALMLHLHELTRPATMEYLDRAHRLYEWSRGALLATDGPTAGLYHDKILGDGGLDRTQWAYNSGNAVAAGMMLHRATGDRRYLAEARATAEAALAYYDPAALAAQPAIFVAILFRTLLQLPPSEVRDRARAAMRAYADRAWADAAVRDARTDLCRIDRATPNVTLLDQAAMVQINALLAWPEEQYGRLA
jgi:hypothetical protein